MNKKMRLLLVSLLLNGSMTFCAENPKADKGIFSTMNQFMFGKKKSSVQNTALTQEIKKGPKYIEGLSAESNAWLDQQDRNIGLLLATVENDVEKMRTFLDDGADVNFQHENNQTALHMVTMGTGNLEALTLLILHNARQDIVDNKGLTAADYLKKRYGH